MREDFGPKYVNVISYNDEVFVHLRQFHKFDGEVKMTPSSIYLTERGALKLLNLREKMGDIVTRHETNSARVLNRDVAMFFIFDGVVPTTQGEPKYTTVFIIKCTSMYATSSEEQASAWIGIYQHQ